MGRWTADRLAAATGMGFVALFIIAFFVATKPPDSTDPNAEWVTYFVHHHRSVLVSAVLFGASAMFFLWFSGSVSSALRGVGQTRLASVAFGGGSRRPVSASSWRASRAGSRPGSQSTRRLR
jgi:predicted membrane metal-binding protein